MLEEALGRTCEPMGRGIHAGAGLLAGLTIPWGIHTGVVCRELQPVGRAHIGEVHGGLHLVGETPR